MARLEVQIGRLRLKNPVIAAAGEHLIDAGGIRSAILAGAGAGAVVGKSINESDAVISSAVADLEGYCSAKGVDAADLIGRAADARKRFADMPRSSKRHSRGRAPRLRCTACNPSMSRSRTSMTTSRSLTSSRGRSIFTSAIR